MKRYLAGCAVGVSSAAVVLALVDLGTYLIRLWNPSGDELLVLIALLAGGLSGIWTVWIRNGGDDDF